MKKKFLVFLIILIAFFNLSFVLLKKVDNKIIVGYQGWFTCYDHWFQWGTEPTEENLTVDLWPDVSEYPDEALCPTQVMYNGQLLMAYDSRDVVDTHFRWMSEYGIDAAEIQRFINRPAPILNEVVTAAQVHDIEFYVQYDGLKYEDWTIYDVMADWQEIEWIVDSPQYMHYEGKPLISFFGVGYDTYPVDWDILIQWFKDRGYAVMVGVPPGYTYPEADLVKPWTVGQYTNKGEFKSYFKKNMKGEDIVPVIWPGFSWYNLTGETWRVDRTKKFFKVQLNKTRNFDYVYVAMFDEVDEGTAIYKTQVGVPDSLVVGEGDLFLRLIRDR